MLLYFTVKNWKSFKGEATLNMLAGRERSHFETLAKLPNYQLKVLPISAIYGANAAGKSNLIKAVEFLQNLILDPKKGLLNFEGLSFKLNSETREEPSEFEIQLCIKDVVYTYSISFSHEGIKSECLKKYDSKQRNQTVFIRNNLEIDGDDKVKKLVTKDSINVFLKLLRDDNYTLLSLFSTLPDIKPVYDWFQSNLKVITPTALAIGNNDFIDFDGTGFDTGVVGVKTVQFKEELPPHLKSLCRNLQEGQSMVFRDSNVGSLNITNNDGNLVATKILAVHKDENGEEVLFPFSEESDGSIRLFDLSPAFRSLNQSTDHTVFIDELDRSLHTTLSRYLVEMFLDSCDENTRKQLIFTTHDVQLIDQSLFRRDELWICQRNRDNSTTLYPINDFKELRADKDIRKSYLQGRVGGIPRLSASCAIQSNSFSIFGKGNEMPQSGNYIQTYSCGFTNGSCSDESVMILELSSAIYTVGAR